MNKQKTILLAFLVSTIGFAKAQTNKFDIGIEGSPSLISLRGNPILDTYHKPTIGFSSGVFFQYNFRNILSLRTNLAFERKGSVAEFQYYDNSGRTIGEVTMNTNFNYLTMPVLARATFGKKIKYFVNAGPYVGLLLKETYVSKSDNMPQITSDNTSSYKEFDFGFSTGLGLLIPIKQKLAFTFEARNNLGLYNVAAHSVYDNGSIKTQSTNFLIGIAYHLGSRTQEKN